MYCYSVFDRRSDFTRFSLCFHIIIICNIPIIVEKIFDLMAYAITAQIHLLDAVKIVRSVKGG